MPRKKNVQRHEDLAAIALDVIVERGVAEFSMADIGKAAKVSRSLLYWYFPSGVSDALRAAGTLAAERRANAASTKMAAATHPIERLDQFLLGILEDHARKPRVSAVLVAAGVGIASAESTLSGLSAELRAGLSDGRVCACSPEQVVTLCAASLDGALSSHQPGLAAVILNALRNLVLRPLHSGQWRPAPLNLAQFTNLTRGTGPHRKVDKPGARGESNKPKQVVKPRGSWLELD